MRMEMWVVLPAVLLGLSMVSAVNTFAEAYSFDSNGVKIHYTIDGEGEPILLIHGYTANGTLNWRLPGSVRVLSENFQVINMDVRGHGSSDKPEDESAYGLEMVEDVVRLLDHLELKSAHVAGYSMGGMIVIKLLTLHPDRVRSAAVCGMGWREPTLPRPSQGARSGRLGQGNPIMEIVGRTFGALTTTEEEMRAIKTPTVIVVGENDPGQRQRVDKWQEIRPDIPVVIVPDATHASASFKDEFKAALKEFFEAQAKER